MITRLWMDEEGGAMSLVVELDEGDGGLFEVDLRTDPPTTVDLSTFEPADHWVEMVPYLDGGPDLEAVTNGEGENL